jgi:large subunit ribosomal protein L21
MDRQVGEPGSSLALPVLLLVDGAAVTSDPTVLAKASVTAEIVDHRRGPKIDILKYKNKTGYRRRQGHRQDLTAVKVTDITPGK